MNQKMKILIVLTIIIISIVLLGIKFNSEKTVVLNNIKEKSTEYTGVYTINGNLYVNKFGSLEKGPVTSGNIDMKPSWSKTGNKIVFFRIIKYTKPFDDFTKWKTVICVINSDGSGFKQITEGNYPDYNPTWSRDGKNNIIFSRYNASTNKSFIYITGINSKPGEEIPVSDLKYSEFAYSSLKDGRILIFSSRNWDKKVIYYLFTPDTNNTGKYEPINFDFKLKGFLERISISPDESKITYEYKIGWKSFVYTGKTIYIADLNLKTLLISNPEAITTINPKSNTLTLYPAWNNDGTAVIYHCNATGKKQLYIYNLTDGSTYRVSGNNNADYEFPCVESTPK